MFKTTQKVSVCFFMIWCLFGTCNFTSTLEISRADIGNRCRIVAGFGGGGDIGDIGHGVCGGGGCGACACEIGCGIDDITELIGGVVVGLRGAGAARRVGTGIWCRIVFQVDTELFGAG